MKSVDERATESAFEGAVQQLDALVQEFDALPYPQIREKVFELLQAIDTVHRESLTRLMACLQDAGQTDLVERAANDPLIRTLLLLYDLLPADERTQVETALASVRPYIHSHGGAVEVLDVADGIVHVRLSGACAGCAGSAMTLRRGIEVALREGFAGFKAIQVRESLDMTHNASPLRDLDVIPLQLVGHESARAARKPIFKPVARLNEVPAGTMRAFDVDGVRVLVANVDNEIYAVRSTCPGSMAPLELGAFTPPIVVCPWHNEAYDVRTGKRADGGQPRISESPGLEVVPIAIVDDRIQVAVNTLPNAPAG